MKRWQRYGVALLTVCALLLAGVNLYIRAEEAPLVSISPSQVERILIFYFDSSDPDEFPQRHDVPTKEITDPEAIRTVCRQLADMYVRECPAVQAENMTAQTMRRYSYRSLDFVMDSGEVRRIDIGRGGIIRIGSRWFYATGGKSDGYLPLYVLLSRVEASYAQRVNVGGHS